MSVGVVGRDVETVALRTALTGGGSAWLVGEAGVGKSVLADHIAGGWDGRVARSSGYEADRHLVFSSLRQIVRELRQHESTPVPDRLLRVVEEPSTTPTEQEAGSWYAIAEATTRYFSDLGSQAAHRWLIVLDDVHWMDDASVRALTFAARRRARGTVSILLATRPSSGLVLEGTEVQRLGLLDDATAADVVRQGARTVAVHVVEAIVRACQGWPLALTELTRSLSPEQLAGDTPLPTPLPPGPRLDHVFGRRTDSLTDAEWTALLLVAVSGDADRARVSEAAAALDVPSGTVDRLIRQGLLRSAGRRCPPTHPLLAAWTTRTATEDQRRTAHRAMAEVLAGLTGADAAHQHAWHLAEAAQGPDAGVAEVLDRVGVDADRRTAGRAAAEAFERAAELSENPDAAVARWTRAARAYRLIGDYPAVLRTVDAAEGANEDPVIATDLQLLRAGASPFQADMAAQLRRMVKNARDLPDAEAGRRIAMLAFAALACHGTDALDLATRAATAAEALTKDAAPGFAHYMRAVTCIHDERWVDGAAEFGHTLDWLDGLPDGDLADGSGEQSVRVSLGPLMSVIGAADGAERAVTPVVQTARASGALGLLAYALSFRGEVRFRLGRWSEAYKDAEEGLDLMRDLGLTRFLTYGLLARARVAAGRGDVEDALADVEASARAEGDGRSAILALQRLTVQATAWSARGDLHRVLASVEASGYRDLEPGLLRGMATVLLLPIWVEAGVRSGSPWAEAEAVLLGRRAQRLGHAAAEAAYLRSRAMLRGPWHHSAPASPDDALALFDRALTNHDRAADPAGTAQTLLARAQTLDWAGRGAAADADRKRASAILEHLGARPANPPHTSGADNHDTDAVELATLTPAERRVAVAVGRGATNRQVAKALGISAKTVEFHLGNIYRKVKVRSRTQLAVVLGHRPGEELPTTSS